MKELARVVYNLVSGSEAPCRSCLSHLEQTALSEMESLLRLPSKDLASLLAKTQDTPEWLEK
jgi:hypothetical protein